MPQPQQKRRVFKFASLTKLVKFDPSDPTCDGMNLSVVVAGPSKVQLQVYNKNENKGHQFGFYLIDFIPWVKTVISRIKAKPDDPIEETMISGSLPEYAIRPGRPSNGSFIISSDDEGPFVQLKLNNVNLPKWRFKPIPNTVILESGSAKKISPNHRLLYWLEMLVGTVTLVSDYIAAIEAREWTPPDEGEIVGEPAGDVKGETKKKEPKTFDPDDDIPF